VLSLSAHELSDLHFEALLQDNVRFHCPCFSSTLTKLSLTRVTLGPGALDALVSLRVLSLVGCTVLEGSLPLGLEQLTVRVNCNLVRSELLRVCATLECFDIWGSLEVGPSFLLDFVRAAPRLRSLTAASALLPITGDGLQAVTDELKEACGTLTHVALHVIGRGAAAIVFNRHFS
jgi:hypothetical protein